MKQVVGIRSQREIWTGIVRNLIEDINKKATCVTHKPFNHAEIDQLIQ